ncbi:reverse transcriptase domain-containing protein [Tanacetum coccineum]
MQISLTNVKANKLLMSVQQDQAFGLYGNDSDLNPFRNSEFKPQNNEQTSSSWHRQRQRQRQRFEINPLLKIEKERYDDMEKEQMRNRFLLAELAAESLELFDKLLALMANFAEESFRSSTTTVKKSSEISTPPVVAELHVAFDLLRDALSAIFGLSELKEIIVMSADSAVTYTSVHSEARSWSIPSEDPYEEAAQQLLEQAPRSPEYIPDPMELEDHVPVYIPEPEHPEDLVPAEDEAPTPLLPPSFLSPHHIILSFETKSHITEFAATLPSSSPPPENVESLKDNIRETMTTVDQGMSVEEIERVIAERVANAIEAIAIYETKTNMARKSISQTEQQECKVAENANNKRKWEGNHNGQCTVKFGNCKKVDHMTQDCRNPAAARNQRTHACYECGSLRHFKSECPIVKFQKRVDKKISTLAERQTENKRKFENTSRNSQNQQQQQIKRQNTGRAYTAGSGDKKPYGGSKPLCSKCNYHHDGPCAPKCYKCNKYGHIARDCRGTGNANAVNNQRVTVTSQKIICYECGNQGHYKRDCPERKNQSHKNQIEGTRAHGVVHTLRGGETDQGPNNIKDGIEA